MELPRIFFWIVAAASLASAFLVVVTPNVVRAAVALAATLFTVAVFYLMLAADFVAVVQVLVYIGGVIVMILFTVMFTRRSGSENFVNPTKGPLTLLLAALFCGGLFAVLFKGFRSTAFRLREIPTPESTLTDVGNALLTTYVLPFEIVSILLLMALVGAVILIKKEVKEKSVNGESA